MKNKYVTSETRHHGWKHAGIPISIILIISDMLIIIIALVLAVTFREFIDPIRPFRKSIKDYIDLWYLSALWPILLSSAGLYRGLWLPGDRQLKGIFEGSSLASLILIALTFLSKQGESYSRAVVLGLWLLSIPLLAISRSGWKYFSTALRLPGKAAVLLGSFEGCTTVLRQIADQRPPAFRIVAVFIDDASRIGSMIDDIPIVGKHVEAGEWAARREIETAILSLRSLELVSERLTIEQAGIDFRHLIVVPDLNDINPAEVDIQDLGGILSLRWEKRLIDPWRQGIKRSIDIAITLMLTIFVVPLGLLIAIMIVLDTGFPIMYSQERVGYKGKHFKAYKFRTMVVDADRVLEEMLAANLEARAEWEKLHKITHDPRITRVGRLLRRLSLDELPQFINIYRGEMSLVGPRPIVENEIQRYGDTFSLYKEVLPGLTGLWQVSGRSTTTYEKRVRLDEYYVRHWSIWLDFVIIARTFLVIFKGIGAY